MAAFCGACKERIIWAKTTAGRSMPLNPDPSPDGNVMLIEGVATVLGKHTSEDVRLSGSEPLYVAHWSTCPNAADFRKAKKP